MEPEPTYNNNNNSSNGSNTLHTQTHMCHVKPAGQAGEVFYRNKRSDSLVSSVRVSTGLCRRRDFRCQQTRVTECKQQLRRKQKQGMDLRFVFILVFNLSDFAQYKILENLLYVGRHVRLSVRLIIGPGETCLLRCLVPPKRREIPHVT